MELLPAVGSERLAGTYYGFYYLVSSLVAAAVSWLAGALLDAFAEPGMRWLPWAVLLLVGLAGSAGTLLLERRGALAPRSPADA